MVLGREHRQLEGGSAQAAKQAASAGGSLAVAPSAPTSAGRVLGTSVGTMVAVLVPRHIAMQWAGGVEGLDLLRLGRGGSVAAMRCLLCRGRDVTHVSVNMWHTEGWSARNIKLAQEVAWYLRSLRDRLLAWEVSSTCFQSISCRCLRLLKRSDTSKDGAEAMQHGRSTTTSWSTKVWSVW